MLIMADDGRDEGAGVVGADVSPQDYARGLIAEETSEVGVALGKATRFGLDTPGPETAPYFGATAREMIAMECGDILAAIDYAIFAGLMRRDFIEGQRTRKLRKLLDPNSLDNLGRRLAPDPFIATPPPERSDHGK
jgi:hypothetical protein